MTSSQITTAPISNKDPTETTRSSTNAVAVAVAFLNWYYNNLHQDPSLVFGCYKDNSVLIRAFEDDPPAADIAHFGLEAIKLKLKTSNLLGCEVLFSVIDAQPSVGGGVIVLGTGTLTLRGESPRRFMQTFFLATQEEPKGYYVANDIMRFLSDSSLPEPTKGRESITENSPDNVSQNTVSSSSPFHEKPSEVSPPPNKAEENSTFTTPPTSSVTEATSSPNPQQDPVPSQFAENPVPTPATSSQPEPSEVSSKPTENAEQNNSGRRGKPDRRVKKNDGNKSNKYPRERKHEGKHRGAVPEQSKLEHANAPLPSQDTSSQQAPAPQQTSWASVLNKNQKPGGNQASPKSTEEPHTSDSQSSVQASEAGVHKTSPKNSNDKQKPFGPAFPKGYGKPHNNSKNAPSCSLYVGGVPYSATQKDISDVFSKFGPLKDISLNEKGFAFVEFQNSESLVRVLAAAPIQVGDRTVTVEERRTKEIVHNNKYFPRKNWNNNHENFHNLQNGNTPHIIHENNTNNNTLHTPTESSKNTQDFNLNHRANGISNAVQVQAEQNHNVANLHHNNAQFNHHADFSANQTANHNSRHFDNNRNNRRRGK